MQIHIVYLWWVFLHLTQKLDTNGRAPSLDIPQSIVASGLLSRMAGWSDAAELCLQVMEKEAEAL